jgi:galactokinase
LSAANQFAAFWVPGRIEFLGKHTDYAGGRSLVCAVDRGIACVARPRRDSIVRLHDALRYETVETSLSASQPSSPLSWATYPATVARRIVRNFPDATTGVDIAFASDLPLASGMSSSTALMIAIYLAIEWANGLSQRDDFRCALPTSEALAGYLGAMENGQDFGALEGGAGVGTMSGCQDQTAILCSQPGALVQYSFCPVRAEGVVSLPLGYVFGIASSGVRAEKSASAQEKYNAVARKAAAVLALWRAHSGREDATLGGALASGAGAADVIRAALHATHAGEFTATELLERFEQFVTEAEHIIPATADALRRGDLSRVGELVARSQAGADRGLVNQIDETRWLVEAMRGRAIAASAFGAGFGGSVWALLPEHDTPRLLDEWRSEYERAFPQHARDAEFFLTSAGPAASRLV